MKLSPMMHKFVLHWGEMGARWGVSRTVAQIHALLYISERPLDAEEIADTLSVARSNVSTSLKELQSWGLVKIAHQMGDRKDYFTTLQDISSLFRVIVEERKRRELDPTVALLRECMAESDPKAAAYSRTRIGEALAFIEVLTAWYDDMKDLPYPLLMSFLRMGSKVRRYLKAA